MPVYRGSAFRAYLIDRFAMGFNTEAIKAEFKAVQGVELTDKDIDSILSGAEDEIKKREEQLKEELASSNFLSSLHDIRMELSLVREEARTKGDMKGYAQLTNSLLKTIETLIQISENFKKKLSEQRHVLNQNNYLVLTVLEKDGLIQIKDIPRLKELWGVKDDKTIEADADVML